jgi:regulator of PEP synthase PpsR (kinase-PPPase family)
MKKLIVHLVSDASGQTVKNAARTALLQFAEIEVKDYIWPLIKNNELLDEVLLKISKKPGVVVYTITTPELREALKKFCKDLKVPCISVVGKIVKEISQFIGIGIEDSLNNSSKFDSSYFDKVDAIDYMLRHDDGQMVSDLENADIILIGPSRTSKTPTSVYLAYNGFKTANVPYVHGCPFPEDINNLVHPLIIGLVISPSRLVEIRETRMNLLLVPEHTSYTDPKIVQEECLQVKRLCQLQNWPVVDVSRRSIEETAALVMKFYYDKKKAK